MTGELDPLAAVRADAAGLDALAAAEVVQDPALLLLAALRGEIDAAVASTNSPGLRRDALLLDALAAGAGSSADPAVALLHALRAAVDGVTMPAASPAVPALASAVARPAPAVVPLVAVASAPVSDLTGERATRRRRRVLRTGVAAGSVALALSMSGVAAAAFSSHPGGALYGLRTQTFGRTDDDPVAAEQVLSDLQKQAAVAVSSPGDAAAAAHARADLTKLHRYLAAEHNPVAQQSIAASAVTVATTVDALPAPVVRATRSPRSTDVSVAGRRGASVKQSTPAGTPAAAGVPVALPMPLEPSATGHAPDASPGAVATQPPPPSATTGPTGTPATTDSPTGTPSPSSTGSADPSGTPSDAPGASTSASASPSSSASTSASATDSPVDSPSAATTVRASPVRTTVAVKTASKPRTKTVRKRRVTATLMTAQLPSSGLPQR